MRDTYIEYSDGTQLVKDPVVSVIMLTYNHERYISDAIEGVVGQKTDFPVELLVGEDFSTDKTREILLGYQKRFPEMIRVIAAQQNVGMHKNHERLVSAARGKYLAYCEGDDFWHKPEKLARQIAVLEREPDVSIVCGNYRVVSDEGKVLVEDSCGSTNGFKDELSYEDMVLMEFGVKTATACTRRNLVADALRHSPQCRDYSFLMGDQQLFLELAQLGRVRCLPEPLATYRFSENSALRPKDTSYSRQQVRSLRFQISLRELNYQFLDRYPLRQGRDATRDQQLLLAQRQLKAAALTGDGQVARTQMLRLRDSEAGWGVKDRAFFWAANLPFRRFTIPARLAVLRGWRAVRPRT